MSIEGLLHTITRFDGAGLLAMFWYLVLLEGPRYLFANFAAVVSAWGGRATPRERRPSVVSVILPAHNGAAGVIKSVKSLREQTLCDLEIIVVDDGSTDDMKRVCSRLQRGGQIDVFLSSGLRGGKSAALNLGLRYCSGDLVITIDADTTFDRDSLNRLVRGFGDPAIGCIGGNVGVRNARQSFLAAMQAVEYMIGISLGRRAGTMLGLLPVASGAFSAFRREALLSVGGWEAGPGEDADLTLKLRRAGWKIGFAAEAWALTDAPTTFGALLNQRLRWEGDLVRLHLQKFPLVAPWRRQFSLRDAAASLEVLLFSVGLSFAFVVYVAWVVAHFGALALPILLISGAIYSVIGTATFLLASGVSSDHSGLRLLPYAFGYGFYCICVLNPIRIWAYVGELIFSRSYRSGFVPGKVIKRVARF